MQRQFCPVHGHQVPNFSPSLARLNISDAQPHTPSPMTMSPSPLASPRPSPHSSPSTPDRLDVSGSPLAFSKWARKTVAELKEILADKGLPISGNKTILIERLETWERNPNDPRLREKRKVAESKPKEPAIKRSSPAPPAKPVEEGQLLPAPLHVALVRLITGKYEQIIEATKNSFKGYALSLHDSGQFDLLKQLTVTRPDGTRSVGEDFRGNWYLTWRKGSQPFEGAIDDHADQFLHSVALVLQSATRNGGQPAADKFVVAVSRVSMPSRWVLRVTMGAFGTIVDVECEPEGGKEMMLRRRLAARPNGAQLRDDCLRLLKRQPNVSEAAEVILGTEARRGLLLDVSFLCEQRRFDEALEVLCAVTGAWVLGVLPRASDNLQEFLSVYMIAVRKMISVLGDLRLARSDMLSETDLNIIEFTHKEAQSWKRYLQGQQPDLSTLDQNCTDDVLRGFEAVLAMRAPPSFSLDSLLLEASRASLSS